MRPFNFYLKATCMGKIYTINCNIIRDITVASHVQLGHMTARIISWKVVAGQYEMLVTPPTLN